MRRTFTPPTSLALIFLGVLLAPVSGIASIRVNPTSSLFGDIDGAAAIKASMTLGPSDEPSIVSVGFFFPLALTQSTSTLQGRITDSNRSVVSGAKITAHNNATAAERSGETDDQGYYQIAILAVGSYRIEVRAGGFKRKIVGRLDLEVGRMVVQDFELEVGDINEIVSVTTAAPIVELATISVGQVIDQRTVQNIPLNGRYFLDLALLIPGSVTPPQSGFSTTPGRGQGALAVNTAGNREETVNYMINGITLTNETFNSISFQPSIGTIQEFKLDNSTFSAEYGQNSGAIVNMATRSGTNELHGELFEFLRNDALDARNFFDFTSSNPQSFRRNQFGGNLGGPIVRNRTFFFFSYEGLRQRQGLALNSVVLSDGHRASVTEPVTLKLINLIPRPNFTDEQGTARFIGSATAPVDVDQWAIGVSHDINSKDRLYGFYDISSTATLEPSRSGNTIPGFGHTFRVQRQLLTLNETHTFSPDLVNEIRFGFNRLYGTVTPNAQLNPADFGINNGVNRPIGLPQINIAGVLNFGGPANFPQGRGDTTFVVSDTLSHLRGSHSLKFGGEFREFLNNNFALDTGRFNFANVAAFLAGTANSFSITLGNRTSSISQKSVSLFVQDNYRCTPNLTLELGMRYDWNATPTERYDRFIVFDPSTVSLVRVGQEPEEVYHQNNKNFQPRVGFAWDPLKDGKTSVRGAYAILVDQPMTSIVTGTAANPPLAVPLTFTGPITFNNALNLAQAGGLAPQTIDHGYDNAYMQSWNLNVQRELMRDFELMLGYFGSKGTHLVIRRNINQPLNGIRPYPALSPSSPILPGTPLGNITQVESTGNSSYNALWVSASKRLSSGVQFNASYTWSKSLDYNSLSSQGVVVQNSYNLRGDRGLSDFDARHRFVLSAIYELPFRGNRLINGWQIATIVQSQSGNPVNIVTSNSTVNGVANTLRPNVNGPIRILGSVDRWFDTSVFVPVTGFGSLGRDLVTGPGFNNIDFSIIKNTNISERLRMELRAEFFNLFNHANFGQPGNVVGTPNFGRITNTRFPTGESGSSRQVQLAMKLNF